MKYLREEPFASLAGYGVGAASKWSASFPAHYLVTKEAMKHEILVGMESQSYLQAGAVQHIHSQPTQRLVALVFSSNVLPLRFHVLQQTRILIPLLQLQLRATAPITPVQVPCLRNLLFNLSDGAYKPFSRPQEPTC